MVCTMFFKKFDKHIWVQKEDTVLICISGN